MITIHTPSNAPICVECGDKYGELVRSEFPLQVGECSICGESGEVCRARDYGNLPNLPQAEVQRLIKMALHCGFAA